MQFYYIALHRITARRAHLPAFQCAARSRCDAAGAERRAPASCSFSSETRAICVGVVASLGRPLQLPSSERAAARLVWLSSYPLALMGWLRCNRWPRSLSPSHLTQATSCSESARAASLGRSFARLMLPLWVGSPGRSMARVEPVPLAPGSGGWRVASARAQSGFLAPNRRLVARVSPDNRAARLC